MSNPDTEIKAAVAKALCEDADRIRREGHIRYNEMIDRMNMQTARQAAEALRQNVGKLR